MAVQEETHYRCIHAGCARAFPRRVNFCPYCGTPQRAGMAPPAAAPSWPAATPSIAPAAVAKMPEPAPAVQATQPAAAVRPAEQAAPPAHAGTPASPPQREPVRLRWWLLALAALWLAWLWARPAADKIAGRSAERIDERIDRAVVLATECKSREAQSELIALRSTAATQQQLEQLQQALNDAASSCRRSRQQNKGRRARAG